MYISTPTVIFQVLLTAFSQLSAQDIITVLAWHQNPHLLFQKLERTMENLIWDISNKIEEQSKTLSFRELKERLLWSFNYTTNNIWGRRTFFFNHIVFFLTWVFPFFPLFIEVWFTFLMHRYISDKYLLKMDWDSFFLYSFSCFYSYQSYLYPYSYRYCYSYPHSYFYSFSHFLSCAKFVVKHQPESLPCV